MSINASPATVATDEFSAAVSAGAADPARIVVEITEHAAVDDYEALLAATGKLQRIGARLAVDDVGMGFSGLNRILRLSPDIMKIDAAVVRDLHLDEAKKAMILALVSFSARTRTTLVAEGVETESEWDMLHRLGVTYAQGYLIARPQALDGSTHVTH